MSRATYSHTDTSEEKEEDDEEEEGDDENDKELLENVFIGLANGKSYVNFKDLMDWDFVLDLFYEVRFILVLVCIYVLYVCMYVTFIPKHRRF